MPSCGPVPFAMQDKATEVFTPVDRPASTRSLRELQETNGARGHAVQVSMQGGTAAAYNDDLIANVNKGFADPAGNALGPFAATMSASYRLVPGASDAVSLASPPAVALPPGASPSSTGSPVPAPSGAAVAAAAASTTSSSQVIGGAIGGTVAAGFLLVLLAVVIVMVYNRRAARARKEQRAKEGVSAHAAGATSPPSSAVGAGDVEVTVI